MLSLLRMDLYRLKRGKAVYICLGILFAAVILSFTLFYLMATPEGQKTAVKIHLLALSELDEWKHMLDNTDTIGMLRESCMDGGIFTTIVGIVTALFVCSDFQNGFIKNILSFHRKRWKYIGSKMIAAGILNFFYLFLCYMLALLMNALCHNMVPAAGFGSVVFYLAWTWLITTAFTALIILVCTFTRSPAAGVLVSVLFGSGMVVSILAQITGLFHADKWLSYTLYYNMYTGPSCYSQTADLKVFAIGFVFLAVYSTASVFSVSCRDV